jgi:nicotinate-nucleotide adenylyltransferase
MLALALRDERNFIPSLIEGPSGSARPNYTLDTIRRFRAQLDGQDRLFFILGIDAFLDVPAWHKPKELVRAVEFIVVSRPGFELTDAVVTATLKRIGNGKPAVGARVHVVARVAEDVSSTALRRRLAFGPSPKQLLDPAVVEYIRKEHLYGARRKHDT